MRVGLFVFALGASLGCRSGGPGSLPSSGGTKPQSEQAARLLESSRDLLARGDPYGAVEALELALGLWPTENKAKRLETRRLLIHACAIASDPERELAHVVAALEEVPEDPWLWYAGGVALTAMGRLDEALDAFGQAIAIDASHAKALQWRGEVRVLLGRLDAAVLDLTRALELLDTVEIEDLPEGRDAMRIRVLFQRAGALDALGRHDEARADREAARADPGRQPAELTPGASGR